MIEKLENDHYYSFRNAVHSFVDFLLGTKHESKKREVYLSNEAREETDEEYSSHHMSTIRKRMVFMKDIQIEALAEEARNQRKFKSNLQMYQKQNEAEGKKIYPSRKDERTNDDIEQ